MTEGSKALPPTSSFAGDDGAIDPALAAALGRLGAESALSDVVAALATARVLVPILAQLDVSTLTAGGLTVDKEASTGVVALRARDGRTALPVFSQISAMTAWRADARPVPAEGPRAATAALQEGWEVLVVDPAGPVTVEIPHPAVRALASGERWTPAVDGGEVRPEVQGAVARCLEPVEAVLTSVAVPGRRAEIAIVLGLAPGLDRRGLDAVLTEVGRRLAVEAEITALVDSLELRVVTAR